MSIPHRKPNRFAGWDYSTSAYYFVTICTYRRQTFFGQIKNEHMGLNKIGKLAKKYWQEIPQHFDNIELDEFIIMPNHVHGIIFIQPTHVGDKYICPLPPKPSRNQEMLPRIISNYKAVVTRYLNKSHPDIHFRWQRSFYDHIIRKKSELNNIREYIHYNPHKWHRDLENSQFRNSLNRCQYKKMKENYYKNIYS